MTIRSVGPLPASPTYSASGDAILTVSEGEIFRVETPSILSRDGFEEATDFSHFAIPVTGPILIDGALPGDLVQIDIHDIEIADRGAMVTIPGRGGFSGEFESYGHVVEIRDGVVQFDEQVTVPVNKMIGKLGLAPAAGEPSSSTVGTFAGNMDCKELTTGSSIIIPVELEGGRLYLGDLHAAQGDGESSLTAVEVEGAVTLSCRVIKHAKLQRPMLRSGGRVITMGDGDTLDEAAQLALDDMLRLIQEDRGWRREKAAMLISAAGDVAISQLVNPRRSVKVLLDERYFTRTPLFSAHADSNIER